MAIVRQAIADYTIALRPLPDDFCEAEERLRQMLDTITDAYEIIESVASSDKAFISREEASEIGKAIEWYEHEYSEKHPVFATTEHSIKNHKALDEYSENAVSAYRFVISEWKNLDSRKKGLRSLRNALMLLQSCLFSRHEEFEIIINHKNAKLNNARNFLLSEDCEWYSGVNGAWLVRETEKRAEQYLNMKQFTKSQVNRDLKQFVRGLGDSYESLSRALGKNSNYVNTWLHYARTDNEQEAFKKLILEAHERVRSNPDKYVIGRSRAKYDAI